LSDKRKRKMSTVCWIAVNGLKEAGKGQRENVLGCWKAKTIGYWVSSDVKKRSRVCWVSAVDVKKMDGGQWMIARLGCWNAFLSWGVEVAWFDRGRRDVRRKKM
jgi:hypothetical protein